LCELECSSLSLCGLRIETTSRDARHLDQTRTAYRGIRGHQKEQMDTPYGTILKCYALAGPISYWVPAPFGRFNVASRFSLPGRASFMIQEVVGPICFLYRLLSYGSSLSGLQQLASAMFVLHYLNRSILFPLFVQPSYSDSHLGVVLSAGLWQLCNGTIQAMAVHKLPSVSGLRTTLALLVFAVGIFGNI
ncbi:hypothetical protein BCR37DRAFT_407092, partial [Protomyces lactucae-debilis]